MSNEERSLAEIDTETEEMMTAAVERGPLDVSEFLAGVRLQRRSVQIRPNLHLLAELERLVDDIDAAPADADVDALIDEYVATRGRFEVASRWVVEQRTPERRRHVRREAAKALGIELSEDGDRPVTDDADLTNASAVEAYVIADHIVEPVGVTADQVRALYEASPGEYRKIDMAAVLVQRVLNEESEKVVLRDFSSRRSAKTTRS